MTLKHYFSLSIPCNFQRWTKHRSNMFHCQYHTQYTVSWFRRRVTWPNYNRCLIANVVIVLSFTFNSSLWHSLDHKSILSIIFRHSNDCGNCYTNRRVARFVRYYSVIIATFQFHSTFFFFFSHQILFNYRMHQLWLTRFAGWVHQAKSVTLSVATNDWCRFPRWEPVELITGSNRVRKGLHCVHCRFFQQHVAE